MRVLILVLLLSSCAPANINNKEPLNFDKILTFNEFNNLLIEYNKINDYPKLPN